MEEGREQGRSGQERGRGGRRGDPGRPVGVTFGQGPQGREVRLPVRGGVVGRRLCTADPAHALSYRTRLVARLKSVW